MFCDIKEYIKLDREFRRSHLDLISDCIEIGGHSREFRALLAYHLKTTIPFGRSIFLCHACHNSKCSNVSHLYWGTQRDNSLDADSIGKSIIHYTNAKYGEGWQRKYKEANSRGGKANAGKPKSDEHKRKLSEAYHIK